MIDAEFHWNGDRAEAFILGEAWERLVRAVEFLFQTIWRRLSTSAGPYYVRRKRNTSAGPKGSQYTKYANPSKPGEPPHLRTGWGRGNVFRDYDALKHEAIIGVSVNAKYMAILELFRNRPWLMETLRLARPQMEAILGQPVQQAGEEG